MSSTGALRLGTRASPLARWQAEWVAARLAELAVKVELVPISTRGDRQQVEPIGRIAGGDGVFTKELQRALLAGEIDLAVHSLKDLPTEPVDGLRLGAVPERGPNGDMLVCRGRQTLEQLPPAAVVGTGSLRRRAQLWHVRPDLRMADIRGNVDTRIRKLQSGEYDALVLAEAGLQRLGLGQHLSWVLPKEIMLPAIGQGALGLEIRADDRRTLAAVAPLEDPLTRSAVGAERAMLAALCGGCLAPIGAWGRVEAGRLKLCGVVLSADGKIRLSASGDAEVDQADDLGGQVAADLIGQGAAQLIDSCRAGG